MRLSLKFYTNGKENKLHAAQPKSIVTALLLTYVTYMREKEKACKQFNEPYKKKKFKSMFKGSFNTFRFTFETLLLHCQALYAFCLY